MEHVLMFAKWATDVEINDFIRSIESKNKTNYVKSIEYLKKREENILQVYDEISEKYKQEYYRRQKESLAYKKAFEQKKCICGGNVKYIDSHDFYGCDRYKGDNTRHFNFFGKEHLAEYYINREFRPNANSWVSDVRNIADISKSVTTGALWMFLTESGCDDLSLIWNNRPTEDTVNRFKGAKKRSVNFEAQAFKLLKEIHPNDKIKSQQGIKYKYFDSQHKYAICDFIVISDDTVYIYECKLNDMYKDEVQKETYIDLVSYIIKDRSSDRKLVFKYLWLNDDNIIEIE